MQSYELILPYDFIHNRAFSCEEMIIQCSATNSPPIKDHGSADVKLSSSSLSLGATLGKDDKGHPKLSATKCSVHIGHLDVKFHGGSR